MASYRSEPSSLNTLSAQAQEEAEEFESTELLERQFEAFALQLGLRKATKKLNELRLESSSSPAESLSSFRTSSDGSFTDDSDDEQRHVDHLRSQMRTLEAILTLNSDGLDKLASVLDETNNLLKRFLTQMSISTAAMKNTSKLRERLISQKNEIRSGGIALELDQDISGAAYILGTLLALVLIFNNGSGYGSAAQLPSSSYESTNRLL